MIRYCFPTGTDIKAYKKSTGQWTVDGIGAEAYIDGITTTLRSYKPFNTTFYFTPETNECLERLSNNESDSSSVFLPIETIAAGYFVPHPLFSGRLQFVSGYNVSEGVIKEKDSATVAANFFLLEAQVYFWSLILFTSFISFIAFRVTLMYLNVRRLRRLPLIYAIKRQISKMIYRSSIRFKLITMLYCILYFYLVTSFLCVYKTSQVIVEKPFYAKSYQESLEHATSLAFYYDQFSDVSSNFKNAPRNSLRGKLWAKLHATGRQDDYSAAKMDPSSVPGLLKKGADEMNVLKGICIVAPLIGPLLKSTACGFSPENELWIVKLIADPIEPEVIYGHAIAELSPFAHFIARKIQFLSETRVIARGFELGLDQSAASAELAATSAHHRWRQKVVCENENAFTSHPRVPAISFFYFRSFFAVCISVWFCALVLNWLQIRHFNAKLRTITRIRRSYRSI